MMAGDSWSPYPHLCHLSSNAESQTLLSTCPYPVPPAVLDRLYKTFYKQNMTCHFGRGRLTFGLILMASLCCIW